MNKIILGCPMCHSPYIEQPKDGGTYRCISCGTQWYIDGEDKPDFTTRLEPESEPEPVSESEPEPVSEQTEKKPAVKPVGVFSLIANFGLLIVFVGLLKATGGDAIAQEILGPQWVTMFVLGNGVIGLVLALVYPYF